MVSSFQIVSNSNDGVNLCTIALHPHLFLQFWVLEESTSSMLHPGYILYPVRSLVVVEVVVNPFLGLQMLCMEYRSQHVWCCQEV